MADNVRHVRISPFIRLLTVVSAADVDPSSRYNSATSARPILQFAHFSQIILPVG